MQKKLLDFGEKVRDVYVMEKEDFKITLKYVLYKGDAEMALKQIPDESIHLLVTSPPYFRHERRNQLE